MRVRSSRWNMIFQMSRLDFDLEHAVLSSRWQQFNREKSCACPPNTPLFHQEWGVGTGLADTVETSSKRGESNQAICKLVL
jgi:hypothetical protein